MEPEPSVTAMQVWIDGQGEIDVRPSARPEPGPGEVLLRTANAGICGSDLHTFRRGHPWLPYPIAPGHEASAWIAGVGAGVGGWSADEPVYVQPAVSCGTCFTCRRGLSNLCERLVGVGSHTPGAMADYFVVPTSAVRRLPDVSMAAGAMIEPLATGVHAVAMAGGVAGRTIAVIGGGTIGQLTMLAALSGGADRVVVTDLVAAKLSLALRLGAAAAIDAGHGDLPGAVTEALSGRPDVVFDCVGSPSSIQSAAGLAEPGGRVVIVGVGHGAVTLPIELLQDREVTVGGSAMYVERDFTEAERLVAAGLPVADLVTSQLPITEAAEGFRRAAGGDEVKVHLVTSPA